MQVQLIDNINGIASIKLVGETSTERQWLNSVAEAGSLILSDVSSGSAVFQPGSNLPETITGYQVASEMEEPAVYNFEIIRNQDFSFDFSFFENEAPLSLLQFDEIKIGIKPVNSNIDVLTLTLDNGLTVLETNVLKVSISASMSLDFSCGVSKYDLLCVKEGVNRYYVKGSINVIESVTR